MTRRARLILVVEDETSDALILREALTAVPGAEFLKLEVATSAEAGLEFLRGRGPDEPKPALVLLDLNLPGADGFEFLASLRADPVLRATPVVVLTTSRSGADVARAFEAGANAYLLKLSSYDDTVRQLAALERFWFGFSRLPDQAD